MIIRVIRVIRVSKVFRTFKGIRAYQSGYSVIIRAVIRLLIRARQLYDLVCKARSYTVGVKFLK